MEINKIEKFKEDFMTKKEDVYLVLENLKIAYKHRYEKKELDNSKVEIFISYLEKFKQLVEDTRFFTLEDWWFYSFRIDPKKMSLNLNYFENSNYNDENMRFNYIKSCEIITLDIKSLSVKEYAEKNNVEDGTVRQWIRRGKLLDAYKVGSEWRLPELAMVDEETSKTHQFEWKELGPFLPEEYLFLTKTRIITIYKEPYKDKYVILVKGEKHIVSKQEKEKIELMLISNPMINYHSNNFIIVNTKDDSHYV